MIRAAIGGLAAFCLVLSVPVGAAADFQDGVSAYNAGDYAAAYAAWLPLAEAGDAAAARNLGHLYRTGRGVATDLARALGWYRRAAAEGFAAAQANLGAMYARGQGGAADYAVAAVWFHRAAVQGHVAAQYNLGLLYESGLGVGPSAEVAMAWYHKAAAAGHQAALERLSRLVAIGATAASSEELAIEPRGALIEPMAARPALDADASTLSVAERLSMGRAAYRARDYATAVETWRPLAEAGNAIAQFHMGGLYADGNGVPADADEARIWWTLAAGQGHLAAARRLAALVPEADDLDGRAPAAVLEPGAPDRARARDGAEAPAVDDDASPPAASETVADEVDLAALSGAERLAAGVAAYRRGGYAIAAAAWRPLAEAGNAWAQFYLGGLYHDGDGMAVDWVRAHMWWALAARHGHRMARELMAALEPKMDADALAEAEALATVWRPRE